jgi:NTE family protein
VSALSPALRAGLAGLCLLSISCAVAEAARPRVGLVLGGGGARGSAHLGILEVLEENRVPVDCVAGTSMGALVAGAYVAGIAPAEMKQTIRETDWAGIFDDSAGREAVRMRQKIIDDRYFSALEFGVKDGLRYREGAVAGEKIKLFFNQLVREDLGERSIEELPLPLTLIATDIGTGERVAMRSGNLTSAMRASMSVPGALAPVVREGRKLVDGGLVDNVPIGEVRERCNPDVVIAVNVGSPMLKPEEVGGLLSVVGQMVNLLTEQNVTKSLALLRPQDIYIRPELGNLTAADFDRQMEGAEIGRKAALEVVERIRRLSVSGPEYREWRSKVRLSPPQAAPVIEAIEIGKTRFVSEEALRHAIRQEEGKPLDTKALAEDLVRLYSYGDLRTLDYSVLKERDRTILRITPEEKPWGPDYLRFGLNLSTDFASEANYNVRALYRKTWMNPLGAELLSTVQIGSEQGFGIEYYQPLDHRQRWFVQAGAGIDRSLVGLYLDGDRISDYRVINSRAVIDAGTNLDSWGIARAGWLERRSDASLETGSPIFPDVVQRTGGPRASLVVDTYDKLFFPSRGVRLEADYFDARHVSGGLQKYGRGEVRMGGALSVGDLIFVGQLDGGRSTYGKLPASDLFSLGGPRRLAAFATDQIRGDDYVYGRIEGQFRLTRPLPLLGLSLLAGIQLETGRMKKPVTEPNLTGWLQSYGAYLSTTTAFGPAYFGYANGPDGKGRVYLFLGTP